MSTTQPAGSSRLLSTASCPTSTSDATVHLDDEHDTIYLFGALEKVTNKLVKQTMQAEKKNPSSCQENATISTITWCKNQGKEDYIEVAVKSIQQIRGESETYTIHFHLSEAQPTPWAQAIAARQKPIDSDVTKQKIATVVSLLGCIGFIGWIIAGCLGAPVGGNLFSLIVGSTLVSSLVAFAYDSRANSSVSDLIPFQKTSRAAEKLLKQCKEFSERDKNEILTSIAKGWEAHKKHSGFLPPYVQYLPSSRVINSFLDCMNIDGNVAQPNTALSGPPTKGCVIEMAPLLPKNELPL